jgi:hypothetical protein
MKLLSNILGHIWFLFHWIIFGSCNILQGIMSIPTQGESTNYDDRLLGIFGHNIIVYVI